MSETKESFVSRTNALLVGTLKSIGYGVSVIYRYNLSKVSTEHYRYYGVAFMLVSISYYI